MEKINWCKKQSRGIAFIGPNDNLSAEYYQNAEESLRVLRKINEIQSNMWLAAAKYYIEYFGAYSILMKVGVKCEIHDCTIELVKFLEQEGLFGIGASKILQDDKELRIDNQYYLKNRKVKIDFEQLAQFLLSIKKTLNRLDADAIESIRKKIKRL
jgi:uncharacterized protein (UPF0332 family)